MVFSKVPPLIVPLRVVIYIEISLTTNSIMNKKPITKLITWDGHYFLTDKILKLRFSFLFKRLD